MKKDCTDSAAAGTALATGQKTYNNSIAFDIFGKDLGLVTDTAKRLGKATVVGSRLPFSHATPAVSGANNIARDAKAAGADAANPSGVAFNQDMPDLPTRTRDRPPPSGPD